MVPWKLIGCALAGIVAAPFIAQATGVGVVGAMLVGIVCGFTGSTIGALWQFND